MTATSMSKLDFALDIAARGLPVFPLKPNSEDSLIPNWRKVATTNPYEIRECWKLCPQANIGISTKGLLTIDIDEDCGPESIAKLKSIFAEHSAHPWQTLGCASICTREQKGKGAFMTYALPPGATVETAIDLLAPGISVFGSNDFVVGPGSTINDTRCEFVPGNAKIEPAPSWLLELCGVELPAESKPMDVVALKKPTPVAPTSAPVKTKLDWALEASQYIPVHPLRWYVDPGRRASQQERDAAVTAAKTPLLGDWPNLATQDPEQIRKWWAQWPDANIGGATNDFLVVDIDPRKGGDQTLEFLRLVEDFPETATTNTQGGGQHLLYVAPGGRPLKGGNDKLGQGIDVKAAGGYVLMPGSTIDGRAYTRADDRPMAFAPRWIVEACSVAKAKTSAASKRIVEEDDIAIELATKWMVDRAPVAEEGNRDNTAHSVAAGLYDYGVTYPTALELMLEWNDLKCSPPLDLEDIERVTGSGISSRENAIGCKHPLAPGFDAVEIAERVSAAAGIPTAVTGDAGAWENEPNAIFVDHLKPVDLPAGVLPELVEQFARDRARRLGVDAGAPAAALVTALGSLVPAGNRLQMRQLDTEWTVKPILWTAIIGPPGSNKSATINAAMGPVQKLQSAWRKSFAADEHKRKADETRRATAEKANKAKPESTDKVFEGEAEPAKPRFRQKIYNDATTEALAVALCENPEGLLYHADELAGWLAGMDAYRAKGGKDRAFWLQAKEGVTSPSTGNCRSVSASKTARSRSWAEFSPTRSRR
ncbi:DUF3987 domain-containing protein [Bradyrhizobium sp. MOS001]|nr:bifunctional DNA primase/polymerase [Bradyrhizobium sp. MOS001]TFW55808.1 DUF3987 domain-containing protein [Bradyrhizobium sp. MOS001]